MRFSLAAVHEAVAEAVAERDAIVFRGRRIAYRQLVERTRRLANFLLGRGFGLRAERRGLADWESGQDHLGIYLYNGNEYLEAMLGAYKARMAPFNINYRYADAELVRLLRDARTRALVFHSSLADRVRAIRDRVPGLDLLLQVNETPAAPLLDGAVEYESALAAASARRPDAAWSPDDLYILYTGGTTGAPKGVLWRQSDILLASLGGRRTDGSIVDSLDGYVRRAQSAHRVTLPAPPFMHGAGHWAALQGLHCGATVVIPDAVERFDAPGAVRSIEREGVNTLHLVGDAFGRPLLDALRASGARCPSLRSIVTGGAAMTARMKAELLAALPHARIIDSAGSSETGAQASLTSTARTGAETGRFVPGAHNAVLNETRTALLAPGHAGLGWWARSGSIPLGYLGDAQHTRRTFPVIDGVRYAVPGDRVRLLRDGTLELHGRESATINSGGEKIFAEEVEQALMHHEAVLDAVVVGRPSTRWGSEVVAIVQLRPGHAASADSLRDECARHIARYKLPKAFVFADAAPRGPNGKADYRRARRLAAGG